MNIVLIGFMGAGKSAVAAPLSQLLGYSWVEMDQIACEKTKTGSLQELFSLGGELLLRETEIAIAKEYAPKERQVISTGGGVVLNKIILDYFKQRGGRVVFLSATFATIANRLAGDSSRPLFAAGASAKQLHEVRLPYYLNYADEVVEVDARSVEEIAQEIAQRIVHGV